MVIRFLRRAWTRPIADEKYLLARVVHVALYELPMVLSELQPNQHIILFHHIQLWKWLHARRSIFLCLGSLFGFPPAAILARRRDSFCAERSAFTRSLAR